MNEIKQNGVASVPTEEKRESLRVSLGLGEGEARCSPRGSAEVSSLDRPFLIDPVQGSLVTYRELCKRLSGHRGLSKPSLPTSEFMSVTEWLLARLVRGIPIDLCQGHVGPTTGTAGVSNDLQPIPLRNIDDIHQRIMGAEDCTITLPGSGSGSGPVRVRHRVAMVIRSVGEAEAEETIVWGLAYPLTHFAGLGVLFRAVLNGDTVVNLHGLPSDAVLLVMARHGVNHLTATPTFFNLLPEPEGPLTFVRRITFEGEPLSPATLDRTRAVFPQATFRNIYATPESGPLLISRAIDFEIPDFLKNRLRLVEDEIHLHVSLLGEILSNAGDAGEWYRTGDLAEVTRGRHSGRRRIRILGRVSHGGQLEENGIDTAEVEKVIRAHHAVRDCVVYSRRNMMAGSLCCDMVLKAAVSDRELCRYARMKLPSDRVPRHWRVMDRLTKSRSGKRPVCRSYFTRATKRLRSRRLKPGRGR